MSGLRLAALGDPPPSAGLGEYLHFVLDPLLTGWKSLVAVVSYILQRGPVPREGSFHRPDEETDP